MVSAKHGKRKSRSFEQRRTRARFLSGPVGRKRGRRNVRRKERRKERKKRERKEFADAFYPCPGKRFEIFIGLVEVRRRVLAKFYAVLRSACDRSNDFVENEWTNGEEFPARETRRKCKRAIDSFHPVTDE